MSRPNDGASREENLRVDFLESEMLGLPGARLGMTILPGVKAPGRWDRDLGADLERLTKYYETDTLVTLLKEEEFELYGVPGFLEHAREAGLEVVHFPIKDVSTPPKARSEDYAELVERILGLLRERKTVVVHCRGGLGRTGTVVASVLTALGYGADEAVSLVRKVRKSSRAVETCDQREYVRAFARRRRSEEQRSGQTRRPETASIGRYRGCLLGLAVGDALGTTVEFRPRGTFEPVEDIVGGGHFGLQAGEWTDDTSMALCLAESLIEKRGFDPADQMIRYLRWHREGHMSSTGEFVDIGVTTKDALELFEETGESYAGSTDPYSAGNGSIMRLAPVPMLYAGNPMEAVELSAESSRTTHGATAAVDACRYLGMLLVGALNGAGKQELLSERYSTVGPGYWEEHPLDPEIDEVSRGSFKHREPPEIKGSGHVVRSLEAALWAFYKTDSFREGALTAVNLGDDADTTGAVYGQIAGAYYGEVGIPKPWRRKLAHRLLIEHFAERLFALGPAERRSRPQSPSS